MKSFLRKTIILPVAFLTVLGFAGTALAAAELEPNNDETTANVLKVNDSITGILDKADDVDVYSLTVGKGGNFNIKITPPAGMDAAIEVYDENLEFLFDIDYADTGEVETDAGIIVPGKYYFVVYDVNEEAQTENYTLETNLVEVASPVVSNVVVAPNVFTNNSKNTVKINYSLSKAATVVAQIKDAKGTVITTIKAAKPKGAGTLVWNGLTGTGITAASGAYSVTVYAIDGEYGNVSAKVIKSLTVKKVITKINKKGTAKVSSTKVLASPVSSAKVVTTLTKGTKFTVLEVDGNWYKVKLTNGKIGYINKSSVTV